MKAFWWFKESNIAGMARPGFNAIHWLDLPFVEAVVIGWLGLHSEGPLSLESFRHHLQTYAPKMFFFHQIDEESGRRMLKELSSESGFKNALSFLNERTELLEEFFVESDQLHFKLSQKRLQHEIDHLKSHGITQIVSLTEKHHWSDTLKSNFSLRHIAIQDLEAPTIEQVKELADVIHKTREGNERLAVHCMAGIGRTSTMLLASHLMLGEKADDLEALIKRQNPKFILAGSQRKLIETLSGRELLT